MHFVNDMTLLFTKVDILLAFCSQKALCFHEFCTQKETSLSFMHRNKKFMLS